MINRLLEKMIQFLMKRYAARKGTFSNYSLSFDDKDFIDYAVIPLSLDMGI